MRVAEIGTSYERRTMRLYVVSSPENIARLDALRHDLDKLQRQLQRQQQLQQQLQLQQLYHGELPE